MPHVLVSRLIEDSDRYGLRLEFVSSKKGLKRRIIVPWIQKPGLALTGFVEHIEARRVQFVGASEMKYLQGMEPAERRSILRKFLSTDIACVILAAEVPISTMLVKESRRAGVAILQTGLKTPAFYDRIYRYLTDNLTQATTLHGVLVDVFGVGILILGKSGIGKSECALDLVLRGHRLVADDVVGIRRRPPSTVYGFGSDLIKHHMEIRGLGIINIKDLFGVASIRDEKVIELAIELVPWAPSSDYDRLGIDDESFTILGAQVPMIRVPVSPGRNITAIIEVAARNQLMKMRGHHSAVEFQQRLDRSIAKGGVDPVFDEGIE